MKPLVVITGFLGAGKTTLLRNLSASLSEGSFQVDAILNDYVNASMEASTISQSVAHVVPIEAGCACCESLEELVTLCRSALEGEGEILLLELNGTADPLPILESFALLEQELPFYPRLQICLIDARYWGQRGDLTELEKRQLETAGYWILTHAESVSDERHKQVIDDIKSFVPHSIRTSSREFETVLANELVLSKERDPQPIESVAAEPTHRHHDSAHRISHRFTGCSLRLPPKVRHRSIDKLLNELPSWVFRAKAMVKLVEEPGCRWLYQRTGSEIVPPPVPVPEVCNVPSSLVCVGPGLDEAWLKSRIDYYFGNF